MRVRLGRDPKPSAAIVDSQSVKTTGVGGKDRGFDPAKKVKGSKRHLLVDTEGLVLEARVHTAPGSPTRTASGSFWSGYGDASRASLTRGWRPATRAGASGGSRRSWA